MNPAELLALANRLRYACLRALPAGPAAPQFSDWDEVVAACESAAHRQSLRSARHIKPECRP